MKLSIDTRVSVRVRSRETNAELKWVSKNPL